MEMANPLLHGASGSASVFICQLLWCEFLPNQMPTAAAELLRAYAKSLCHVARSVSAPLAWRPLMSMKPASAHIVCPPGSCLNQRHDAQAFHQLRRTAS